MKSSWEYKKLNELGFIGRGKSKHRPRNDPSLYGGNYPFIQTSEVKGADLYLHSYTQTYNEKGLSQSKLWHSGTLLITIAANIAETAILKMEACFPDSIVGFVADENKSNVYFVKYSIDTLKLGMQNISRGTTQDNLSLDKLLSFKLVIPPLIIQNKIASILSAYDDLIEKNLKRMNILEEMARMIYREWFVMFRFPGYEKVKMVKSEMGMIPEGWEVKTVKDIANVTDYVANGSFASLKDNVTYLDKAGYAVLVRAKDFNNSWDGNYVHVSEHSYNFLRKSKLHPFDIVIGNVGFVGVVFLVPDLGQPMTLGPN